MNSYYSEQTNTSKVKCLIEVKDSQFYDDLAQIKHSLEIMKLYHTENKDIKTDFTFDHMIKGIENTIKKGYTLYQP